MYRCSLHLYFPPGWELGEGATVDPAEVAVLGEAVQQRCTRAAGAAAALHARGWTLRAGRYEVVAVKACDRSTAMLDFLRCDLDPVRMGLEVLEEDPPMD